MFLSDVRIFACVMLMFGRQTVRDVGTETVLLRCSLVGDVVYGQCAVLYKRFIHVFQFGTRFDAD